MWLKCVRPTTRESEGYIYIHIYIFVCVCGALMCATNSVRGLEMHTNTCIYVCVCIDTYERDPPGERVREGQEECEQE